jgi:hypothetical protein
LRDPKESQRFSKTIDRDVRRFQFDVDVADLEQRDRSEVLVSSRPPVGKRRFEIRERALQPLDLGVV